MNFQKVEVKMPLIEELLSIFGSGERVSAKDNFSIFEAKYSLHNDCISESLDRLPERLNELKGRGVELEIAFFVNNSVSVRFSVKKLDCFDKRHSEYKDQLLHLDDEDEISVEFRVEKKIGSCLNVFLLDVFISYFSNLSLEKSLDVWNQASSQGGLNVVVWDEIDTFRTASISFVSALKKGEYKKNTIFQGGREGIIEKRDKCSHFANASKYYYIPEDFVIIYGDAPKSIANFFSRIVNSLLVIYISDFSSIKTRFLSYRLKGYKLLTGKVDFEDIPCEISRELLNIYSWAYTDGNFADKIGIVRNILSIHIDGDDMFSVSLGTADSVMSGYDLYLKENVKQYIEIKNKLSEFMQGQSDKAVEITKSMFSIFKTALWTFATFFVSVFLLRVLSVNNEEEVFTVEVLVVSLLLILFSFVYLCISILELNADRNRLLNRYSEVKYRYSDLLNEKDLERIMSEEVVKKREADYIDGKRNRYIVAWVLMNALMVAVVVLLYFYGENKTGNVDYGAEGSVKILEDN